MSASQKYQVSESDVSAFERDGALVLRNIVDDAWLERLRAAIDHNMEPDDWYFHYIYMWQRDPELYDFCLNSPLGCAASQLLHTKKVHLVYDQIFVKDEGDGRAIRMAQRSTVLAGSRTRPVDLALDR